jgi:predicted CXXCH cytochrome family protein
MQLPCTGCHTAAQSSTRLEDNLLPRKEVCLGCHEDRDIPPPQATRLARFNHALHLKMGNAAPAIAAAIDKKQYLQPAGNLRRFLDTANACAACHRGLEESEAVTRAAMPQMADCLVCHGSRIQPPFTCEQCHAKDPGLRPTSHTGTFIDSHSSGKLQFDKSTCAVCHGREFTCMGCH